MSVRLFWLDPNSHAAAVGIAVATLFTLIVGIPVVFRSTEVPSARALLFGEAALDLASKTTQNKLVRCLIWIAASLCAAHMWGSASLRSPLEIETLLDVRDGIQVDLILAALALGASLLLVSADAYVRYGIAVPSEDRLNIVALGALWSILLAAASTPVHVAWKMHADDLLKRLPATMDDLPAKIDTFKKAIETRRALEQTLNLDFIGMGGVNMVSIASPLILGLLTALVGKTSSDKAG